jgi:hypothetical protein
MPRLPISSQGEVMSEDEVELEISALVRVHKVVCMPRERAEAIANMHGFDLRNAIERDVVFDSSDFVELEDVESADILGEDAEDSEDSEEGNEDE